MSVAYEFPPDVVIPARAVRPRLRLIPGELAIDLDEPTLSAGSDRPSGVSARRALRVTVRGRVLLALVAVGLGLGILGAAHQSGPPAGTSVVGPALVRVQPGDSLWLIAARVAPGRDPRNEVTDLMTLNHLSDSGVLAGAVLRTR